MHSASVATEGNAVTTDFQELATRLDAAIADWRGLMAQPVDIADDAAAEAMDVALAQANALADAILALPNPTAADLPAVALAFAWRCAGGVPPLQADPELHEAALRLLMAFRAPNMAAAA